MELYIIESLDEIVGFTPELKILYEFLSFYYEIINPHCKFTIDRVKLSDEEYRKFKRNYKNYRIIHFTKDIVLPEIYQSEIILLLEEFYDMECELMEDELSHLTDENKSKENSFIKFLLNNSYRDFESFLNTLNKEKLKYIFQSIPTMKALREMKEEYNRKCWTNT